MGMTVQQVSAAPGGREAPTTTAAEPDTTRPRLEARWLGAVPYRDGLLLQDEWVRRRREGRAPDQLLLLEHPHVITLGTSADRNHVLLDEAERRLLGIELHETGRGGDVTYHGPGQLVGYPILDLKPDRRDLHRYVRDIEHALIRVLGELGIQGRRKEGLTGVWVHHDKVAAIGVRLSSGWITSHGFALNVATNLDFFDAIVPCGIRTYGVTSLARLLDEPPSLEDVAQRAARCFAHTFARELSWS